MSGGSTVQVNGLSTLTILGVSWGLEIDGVRAAPGEVVDVIPGEVTVLIEFVRSNSESVLEGGVKIVVAVRPGEQIQLTPNLQAVRRVFQGYQFPLAG